MCCEPSWHFFLEIFRHLFGAGVEQLDTNGMFQQAGRHSVPAFLSSGPISVVEDGTAFHGCQGEVHPWKEEHC